MQYQMNPASMPLDQIDLSDPALYQHNVAGDFYDRVRSEAPVHWQANGFGGAFWSLTRFDDIVAVESDFKTFTSTAGVNVQEQTALGAGRETPSDSFMKMDPPNHDIQRRYVAPGLSPANLARLEQLIRQRTQTCLDGLPIGETFDWVQDVSIELTSLMLATLLDYPLEERARLIHWSDVATAIPHPGGIVETVAQMNQEMAECAATFARLRAERANGSGTDLISMMAARSKEEISDLTYASNCILLIVGGNDTTRNSMSGAANAFHQFPGEWDKLKANPSLVPSAVSEIIRWQSPVIHMIRTATRDVILHGKDVRAGDRLAMWYLAGNRDPEAIDNPNEFRIDRANPRHHVSFGFGVHRCLGNRLAELQLRILWEEAIKRFSRIEVMGEPTWLYSHTIRGITALPVRLHA